MGSSDLDGLTLAIGERLGNQPSCSLLFKPDQPIVGMACLARGQLRATLDPAMPFPLERMYLCWLHGRGLAD